MTHARPGNTGVHKHTRTTPRGTRPELCARFYWGKPDIRESNFREKEIHLKNCAGGFAAMMQPLCIPVRYFRDVPAREQRIAIIADVKECALNTQASLKQLALHALCLRRAS